MNDMLTKERLQFEVEDLLRNRPSLTAIIELEDDCFLSWLGRVDAVLGKWDESNTTSVERHLSINKLHDYSSCSPDQESIFSLISDFRKRSAVSAYNGLITMLYRARYSVILESGGPISVAVPGGRPYDYFEEVRKIIDLAYSEVFFIDRYLNAEFVSIYLAQIDPPVSVRLLTSTKMERYLSPAIVLLKEQIPVNVEVRYTSGEKIHDRYLIVDSKECYQSGSSFKDGSKKQPTTLSQITDAFEDILQIHDQIWSQAKS